MKKILNINFLYVSYKFLNIKYNQAVKTQAPPTAFILLSAVLENHFALITTG